MSTGYYVTFGYGYHLTGDDVAKLAESVDLEEWGYDSVADLVDDLGYYEVVDDVIHFNNFGVTSAWFYDYNAYREGDLEGTGLVIYRKATTKVDGGVATVYPFPKNTDFNQAELEEWGSLEKLLGHSITFDPFVEVSIG